MNTAPARVLGSVAYGLAISAGLYAVLLGVLLTPRMQRFALYANNFNTLWFRGLDRPEIFGFAKNQVTPFNVRTPDGEVLYAWHILPIDQYARHEQALFESESSSPMTVDDFAQTTAFKILTTDASPLPRVVVSFHGNAGDIAQGWRPDHLRYLSTLPNTHVFTVDYRGFGHSTGSPTEAGLILDGVALVNWIMKATKIPPDRILIIGQSLGTAMASAVALSFANPTSHLVPADVQALQSTSLTSGGVIFAGIVLVAPFNSIPTLLSTYRIGGLLPLLLPLRPFPSVANLLASKVGDKWQTAERVVEYYYTARDSSRLFNGEVSKGSLQIIHAINDADIPYHQTTMICRRILGARKGSEAPVVDELEQPSCIDGTGDVNVLKIEAKGLPKLRVELLSHGGHNRIVTYSSIAIAVNRAFEDLF